MSKKKHDEEVPETQETPAEETVAETVAEVQPEPETNPLEEQLKSEKDRYLRLAAEYDNFRKRSAKEREAIFADVRGDTVLKFLPVYDNLSRALLQETADEAYRKGVEMTMNQLKSILEGLGVTEIEALGQTFDPPVSTYNSQLPKDIKAKLPLYGIDISDLTLGFMYKDLLREEKPESVKTLNCRVFMLKGLKEGETARIFISTEYFFPLKVQWFRRDPAKYPGEKYWRMLEIASVKKAPDSDFYLIPKLEISGPDWMTMINFTERAAGYAKDGMPKDLFLAQ